MDVGIWELIHLIMEGGGEFGLNFLLKLFNFFGCLFWMWAFS